jgi:EPS-associated MarR family transcriptional regulator
VLFGSIRITPEYPQIQQEYRSPMIDEALRYQILKQLQDDPNISQRNLAEALGISLGKVNYCLKGLIETGLIKAQNFKNSKNKLAYAYILTPAGIEEKAKVTMRFFQSRLKQYEELEREIEELRKEVQRQERA